MLLGLLPAVSLAAGEGAYTVSLSGDSSVQQGSTLTVAVDVTSETQTEYNAFYATLTYDSAVFTYDSCSSENDFNVEDAASGTLQIARSGGNVDISTNPDLKLTFTAVGTADESGSFTLTEAKVDADDNARQDAAAANRGGALSVTVTAAQMVTEIYSEDDLRTLAQGVNSGAYTYEDVTVTLMNDVTLTTGWVPIGIYESPTYYPFMGTFDGQGHTITLAYENDTGDWANDTVPSTLFWYVSGATIKNLVTQAGEAGVVCGPPILLLGADDTTVENCVNYADVVGWRKTTDPTSTQVYGAGIAYSVQNGTISDCLNYGDVVCRVSDTFTSGVDSSSSGGISSLTTHYTGGYGGYAAGICSSAKTFLRCGNYGDIYGGASSTGSYSGGSAAAVAVGSATAGGSVEECFNKGNLTVGCTQYKAYVMYVANNGSSIDCYNTGNVSMVGCGTQGASHYVRAFASLATNCYTIGTLSATLTNENITTVTISDYTTFTTLKNENVYSAGDTITADALNAGRTGDEAKWKEDSDGINGGYPLLWWETTDSDTEYTVTFAVTPANAQVTVYNTSGTISANADGTYRLKQGYYSYRVTAEGYLDAEGSFTVSSKDVTQTVVLAQEAEVIFQITPAAAKLTLTDAQGKTLTPEKSNVGSSYATYTYTLEMGETYTYLVTATGYYDAEYGYTVRSSEDRIEIELIKSTSSESGATSNLIYGSLSGTDEKGDALPYTITEEGVYEVAENAVGYIVIQTSDPVTLVGQGISTSARYEYLFIDCTVSGVDLTLDNIYIYNDVNGEIVDNMIDFTGENNHLYFSGRCCLDWDGNVSGYAAIHVPTNVSLTIGGVDSSDVLYLYKHEQGAGIGGNGTTTSGEGPEAEYNGDITLDEGQYFIKGSKQGATIGSGALASGVDGSPGSITIKSGVVLNGIQVSRGAFIGGSAGATGGATGANVYISSGASININVDYSGAAIGGGGYEFGNDAGGGKVYYSGGSIRTYVDYNALVSDGTNLWADYGITEDGVDSRVITANMYNNSGKLVYPFVFDTSQLSQSAGTFTVKDGSTTIYTGGLHEYHYINEHLQKDSQVPISYTWDNWETMDDPNLYLFLTGEDHTLTVNGETFQVKWNGSSFDLVAASSLYTTTVESRVATTTIDSTALTDYLATLSSGGQLVIDVTSDVSGKTVYESVVEMTTEDAAAIGSAGVSLKVESPVADITLTASGMKELGAESGETITISASEESDGVHIDVAVDGESVDSITGGLTVTLSVSSVTQNTILVLVDENGTETELADAEFGTDSVTVQVSGPCVLKVTEKATAASSETNVSDGVATTVVDSSELANLLSDLEEGDILLIEADIPSDTEVYSAVVSLDNDDVDAIADAGVLLLVSSPIADILLPTKAVEDLASERGDTVAITATELTDGISIEIAVDGEVMEEIDGGIQVTLPVSDATDNAVLVLINADGTETVLEDAVFSRYSVSVWVDGSCVLAFRTLSSDVELDATTVVEDGVATTTIDSDDLAAVLGTIEAGTVLVITADIPDGVDVTEANTVLTRGDVREMVEAEVVLKVSTPLADIVLSTQALTSIAGDESLADEHEVVITTSERTSGTYIGVTVDGKTVGTVDGGILATLPAENASASSVLVLVDAYGEQTIIRKTTLGDDALTALLSGSCTVKAIENPVYYADVTDTSWYADAVAFVCARELFGGTGDDLFSPTGNMTRSMLVTVLHRLEDNPDATQLSNYGDVILDQWYTDAVHWADENGIVNGYGDGTFGPNDSITREQMATILYRYVQYLGLDVSTTGSLSRFSDGGDTSDWAAEAMRWAVGAGILQGNDEGTLNPLGTASRAEVATMLQRLINLIVQ